MEKEDEQKMIKEVLEALTNQKIDSASFDFDTIGQEGVNDFAAEFPLLSFSVSLKEKLVIAKRK